MRTDSNLARRSFRFSEEWNRREDGAPLTPQIDRRLQGGLMEDGKYVVHSLSGQERNHFFLNRDGKQYEDLSSLSGADSPADSRSFALLDFDHDGWQDLAVVNANTPLFNFYRNQMGDATAEGSGKFIALRFVGGSRIARKNSAETPLACRDGFGALVTARIGDEILKREHRCGEGFGTQNSNTMLIGVGRHDHVDELTVRWPSGKSASLSDVPAGTLLTTYEDAAHSPSKSPFERRSYRDLKLRARPPAASVSRGPRASTP